MRLSLQVAMNSDVAASLPGENRRLALSILHAVRTGQNRNLQPLALTPLIASGKSRSAYSPHRRPYAYSEHSRANISVRSLTGTIMLDTCSECASSTQACDFVVCGWFTPDYLPWWTRLRSNLDEIGAPHDFVKVPKLNGSWERNTRQKPAVVLSAMNRHVDKTIIVLDVDCTVPGGLEGLRELASLPGDIAVWLQAKWKKGRAELSIRNGTMVIHPTAKAREFVERWIDAAQSAPRYANDQHAMMMAMGQVMGLVITTLDIRFTAWAGSRCGNPVILHDHAGKPTSRLMRHLARAAAAIIR